LPIDFDIEETPSVISSLLTGGGQAGRKGRDSGLTIFTSVFKVSCPLILEGDWVERRSAQPMATTIRIGTGRSSLVIWSGVIFPSINNPDGIPGQMGFLARWDSWMDKDLLSKSDPVDND
jgi:hypothetical protein